MTNLSSKENIKDTNYNFNNKLKGERELFYIDFNHY